MLSWRVVAGLSQLLLQTHHFSRTSHMTGAKNLQKLKYKKSLIYELRVTFTVFLLNFNTDPFPPPFPKWRVNIILAFFNIWVKIMSLFLEIVKLFILFYLFTFLFSVDFWETSRSPLCLHSFKPFLFNPSSSLCFCVFQSSLLIMGEERSPL